ncbi:MAG: FliM/FliN family flagellar motor switch protein [Paracoccaceae bacterium]
MRKKLLSGQQAVVEGGPGADRAWRVAFARAARDMMQLPVDFTGLTIARMSLAELLDLPPERALILMLEGPGEGLGLLILWPDLLSALIEVLTMGRCGTQTPEPRKPTRTDAAMLSPLADLALSHLEEALAEDGDLVWTSGFRYASFIEEARPLGLLLDDVTYRVLTARLSLSHGARAGDMVLVLPTEGRGRKPRLKANTVPDAVARPAFSAALARRIEAASSQLEAVLTRVSMPLAEIMRLSVDTVLPLTTAALDRIRFEGLDGRCVAEGKLGQHRGMRAIRLSSGEWQDSAGAQDAASPVAAPPVAAHHDEGTAADWTQDLATPEMAQPFDLDGFPATGTG